MSKGVVAKYHEDVAAASSQGTNEAMHYILYTYESGYCEIREVKEENYYTVLLVHSSEIEGIADTK